MTDRTPVWGLVLIVLGAILLATNLGLLEMPWYYLEDLWEGLWPFALLLAGALFWLGWLRDRSQHRLLFPGTVLLVYGALFLYCTTNGWWNMETKNLWAVFIIGPGLGMLVTWALSNRTRGSLTGGVIVTAVGAVFLFEPHNIRLLWPLALIFIGLRLILRNRRRSQSLSTRETSGTEVRPS